MSAQIWRIKQKYRIHHNHRLSESKCLHILEFQSIKSDLV